MNYETNKLISISEALLCVLTNKVCSQENEEKKTKKTGKVAVTFYFRIVLCYFPLDNRKI